MPYLLRPVLVTGTKIWHMRPDCRFYPHANYEAAVSSMPLPSSLRSSRHLIVCFGEIDCREGIVLALEKARYASRSEAMASTAAIYITQLQRLASRGGEAMTVWVQPVVPVLDVTRAVVVEFVQVLRRLVQELSRGEAREEGAGRVRWLDLFDDLLDGAGGFDSARYGMDGTHLHPRYVQLVEREMNKQWSE